MGTPRTRLSGRQRDTHDARRLDRPGVRAHLVADFAEEWLERPDIRPKTRAGYRRNIESRVNPAIGSMTLAAVRPRDVQAIIDAMVNEGLKANSVRNVGRTVKTLFNAAVDAELIHHSLARRLQLPKPPDPENVGRALEPAEVWALADAIDPRFRALVLTGAFCGLRISELAGLTVGDIYLEERSLYVRRNVTDVRGEPVVGEAKTAASRGLLPYP